MKEWQQITNIEMLVNSIESIFTIDDTKTQINLSCNLLNIARGRFNLFLIKHNPSIDKAAKIIIKEDKPIMEAVKTLDKKAFENIQNQLSLIMFNKNKKIKITLIIDKPLAVDSSGFLLVDSEIISKILSLKFTIPYL